MSTTITISIANPTLAGAQLDYPFVLTDAEGDHMVSAARGILQFLVQQRIAPGQQIAAPTNQEAVSFLAAQAMQRIIELVRSEDQRVAAQEAAALVQPLQVQPQQVTPKPLSSIVS